MKSEKRCILLFSFLTFVQVTTIGQGTIYFNNRSLSGQTTDAPVTLPNGTPAAGEAFTAGLFLVDQEGLRLLATTHFRTGIGAGYFLDPPVVSVPGHAPFTAATFRVRVWETSAGSFENAVAFSNLYGEFPTWGPDNNLFVPSLGPSDPIGPVQPADLGGIQPLTLIPEPSTWALLLLAGGIAWCGRRRHTISKQ